MVGLVVGDLDLLGDCVASGDGGVARVQWCLVNALTPCAILEATAGEPIVSPAWLIGSAVGIVVAFLAADIGALQLSSSEAILRRLLLSFRRQIGSIEEFVYQSLVLTDSISEHASMVTVVIDTPLHFYCISSIVCDDWL